MKSDSLKKNFIFQFLYQFTILVIPLIVSPYLTRVLGTNGLGVYTYTLSIAYYFVVFSMLGIEKYGQRLISTNKDNDVKLRKAFWSLYTVHFLFSFASILFYIIYSFFLNHVDALITFSQSFYVFSAMFDITWFFYGVEKFKPVILRNLFIKILEIILIFVFVKNESDLIIYTIIMGVSQLLCNILLFPFVLKNVKPIKFSFSDLKVHFKPLFILSIAVVSVTLYTTFDKTLLGWFLPKENSAFFEYSNKIITIPKTLISVIGVVLFPRACNCFYKNDFVGLKKYFRISTIFVFFISVGSIFGLLSISDSFSIIYYGKDFAICGNIIKLLSPLIFIIGIGDVLRMELLIPMKKDIQYTVCLILNAVINFTVSFLLLKFTDLGIYSVIIGTLCAETFGLIFQFLLLKRFFDFKIMINDLFPFVLSGLLMFISIEFIKKIYNNSIVSLLFQIFFGLLIYCFLLFLWFYFFSKDKNQFKSKLSNFFSKKFLGCGVVNVVPSHIRDPNIDLLRLIGILLVILAHTKIIEQFNTGFEIINFQVPLLVFVAALSATKSDFSIITWHDYFKYCFKRIKRLLFPCLIFITVYYFYCFVMGFYIKNDVFEIKSIILSYLLISGFGYVWIIRILLLMSFLTPFYYYLGNNHFILKNIVHFYVLIMAINCILVYFCSNLSGTYGTIFNVILLPIIGYSIIYIIGLLKSKIKFEDKIYIFMLNMLIIMFYIFSNNIHIFGQKYPPNLLYIAYGLNVCFVLDYLIKIKQLPKFIEWLSKNSLNLCFSHIFVLYLFKYKEIDMNWFLEFIIIIVVSIILTFLIFMLNRLFFKIKGENKI